MIIKDFSPHIENKTGKPDRIALYAATKSQYKKVLDFFKYYFGAEYPNGISADFEAAKGRHHGNSRILLSCFYNDMTGKYELATTTKTIIKANSSFWPYDFVGNLTDYANTL